MKPVKPLLASGNKLASVPELTYKRRVLNSPLPPKTKEKHTAKSAHQKTMEPMVLRSPPTGESIIRYALPIPSSKTKEIIAEDESIRKITKRLKMVASNLEKTYGSYIQNGEQPAVKAENEGLTLSVGDDLNSSLVSTSQFTVELDETVREEKNILESLFKWFQQQVNQMEEINKDESILEAELPVPNNAIILSISQIIKQVQKLKELKNRLTQKSRISLEAMLSKSKDIENTPEEIKGYEILQQKMQEFIKTHLDEANMDVCEIESQTDYSLTNQFNTMVKIFENRSDVLEKTVNEQDLLETKYKQMENDFQVLSEEKLSLENEIQKLKNSEKTKPTLTQTKKTAKTEKKKDKGKHENSEEKKFLVKESQSRDLQEMQKVTYELEIQNIFLQEKLQQALQEAERAKNQLAYFLNEGRDLLKSEGKSRTREKSIGSIEVEDSEKTPLEKDTIEAPVIDSDGLTYDTLQEQQQLSLAQNGYSIEKSIEKTSVSSAISDISQFPKSQEGSAALKIKDSLEVSTNESQYQILSAKYHNILPTPELSGKENIGLSSAGTLPQEKETVTASLNLPPIIKKRHRKTDNTMSAMLQSKTEEQTSQEGQIQAFPVTQQKDTFSAENQLPEEISLVSRSQAQSKNLEVTRDEKLDNHVKESDGELVHENQDLLSKGQLPVEKQETLSSNGHTVLDDVPKENLKLNHRDSVSKPHVRLKKQRLSIAEKANTQKIEEVLLEIPLPLDNALSKGQSQTQQLGTIKMETPKAENEAVSGFNDLAENLLSTGDQILDLNKVVDTEVEKRSSDTERHTLMEEMKTEDTEDKRLSEIDKENFTYGIGRGEITEEIKKQSKIHSGSDVEDLKNAIKSTNEEVEIQLEKQPLNYPETDKEGFTKGIEKSAIMEEIKIQSDSHFGNNVEHLTDAVGRTETKGQLRTQSLKHSETDIESSTDATGRGAILEEIKIQSKSHTEMDTETFTDVSGRDAIKEETKIQSNIYPGSDVEQLTDAIKRTDIKEKLETQPVSLPETDMKILPDTIGRGTVKETVTQSFTDAIGRGTVKEETQVQSEIHPDSDIKVFVDAIRRGSIKKTYVENFADAVRRGSVKEIDIENFTNAIRGGSIKEADIEIFIDAVERGSVKEETKVQSEIHPGSNVENLTDVIQGTDAKGQRRTEPVMVPETNRETFTVANGRGAIKETDRESFSDAFGKGPIKESQRQSMTHPGNNVENLTDVIQGTDAKEQFRTQPVMLPETDIERFPDAPGRGSIKETDKESFAGAIRRGSIKEETQTQSKIHPESHVEHLTDTIGGADTKEQLKIESLNLADSDKKIVRDTTGRGLTKEKTKDLTKIHPETDTEKFTDDTGRDAKKDIDAENFTDDIRRGAVKETDIQRFTDAIRRDSIREETKSQSRIHPGSKGEHLINETGRTEGKGQAKKQPLDLSEISVEHLTDATGRTDTKEQLKTKPAKIQEADTDHLMGPIERVTVRGESRTQSKSHHEADTDHLMGPIERVTVRGESRTQSKSHHGVTGRADEKGRPRTQPLKIPGVTGTGTTQGEIWIQSKSLFDNDTEDIAGVNGRVVVYEKMKTQSKSHLGLNSSKTKNIVTEQQDSFTRHPTQRTFPTKVVNFSPFHKPEKSNEEISFHVTESPKALPGRSGDEPTIYKTTHLPSKYKESSGADVKTSPEFIENGTKKEERKTHLKSHLDTDIKHTPSMFERGTVHEEFKIQPKSHFGSNIEHLTEADARRDKKVKLKTPPLIVPEHYMDVTGRGSSHAETKAKTKSHLDSFIEHFTGAIGKGTSYGEIKKQSRVQTEHFIDITERASIPERAKAQAKSHIDSFVEQFTGTVGRGATQGEPKTESKGHFEHYKDVTERALIYEEVKKRSKSHIDNLIEKFASVIARGSMHGETKKQSKSHPGSNVGHATDARTGTKDHHMMHPLIYTGSNIGPVTHAIAGKEAKDTRMTHPMTYRGPDTEHFPGAIGRGTIHPESKTPPKSHLDSIGVIGRGAMHGEIQTPSKSHLGKISSKTMQMSAQHQDSLNRHFTQRQFPTKVVTFSPFSKKEHSGEHISPYVTDSSKVLPGRSKDISNISKATHFISPNKESSGHPINEILNQQNEVKNTLPIMTSTAGKGTGIEGLLGAVGRSVIRREMKVQPKSHHGKKYFKTKNISAQHQDLLSRNISPRQFPTKVINFSPFGKEEEYSDYFSHYVTERSKSLLRRSRNLSSIYKAVQFPPLNKEHLGQPNNGILNQQNELTNSLPILISAFKIPINTKNCYHKMSYFARGIIINNHLDKNDLYSGETLDLLTFHLAGITSIIYSQKSYIFSAPLLFRA